jgi:hypothetical protein
MLYTGGTMKTIMKITTSSLLSALLTAISAQTEHKANPADYQDPIMKAIVYGIAAPNSHNSQPWAIDSLNHSEMLLYVRHELPETDPPGRQTLISAGCFIGCMKIGMSAEGYDVQTEYFPEGESTMIPHQLSSKPVAKITLKPDPTIAKDPLYKFIFQRHSNRRPYKGVMIRAEEFAAIQKLTGTTYSEMIFIDGEENMKPYLDIFSEAMAIETRTRVTNEETRLLFRFSEKEREEKRDGLSLAANGLEGIILKIVEKSMKGGDSTNWHSEKMFKATMKNINKAIYSSKGLVFFKTEQNRPIDWIKSGEDFIRYNIAVAKVGLVTSHYNQVIQEYDEMQALQRKFDQLSGFEAPEKVQLILRVGRAKATYPSWRKNPEDFILTK